MLGLAVRDSFLDETYTHTLHDWVSAYMFEALLYGILLVLSVVAAVILIKNKSSDYWRWLLFAGASMLTLATADLVMSYCILFIFILKDKSVPFRWIYPKFFFYVTNNVIADCLVIHRCYLIWGRNKRIIAFPVLALVATSVCGYILQGATSERLRQQKGIYLFMTFALNFIVNFLMAIRILWISRQVGQALGSDLTRKYHYATGLIVESGTIYSIFLLLNLTLNTPQLNVGLVQVVVRPSFTAEGVWVLTSKNEKAIVPTLIIVQVGLGRETRDANDTIQLVRSGFQPAPPRRCDSGIQFTGRRSTDTYV